MNLANCKCNNKIEEFGRVFLSSSIIIITSRVMRRNQELRELRSSYSTCTSYEHYIDKTYSKLSEFTRMFRRFSLHIIETVVSKLNYSPNFFSFFDFF